MSFAEFQRADFAHSFYKTKLLFILIVSLRTISEFFGWMQPQLYLLLVSEYDEIWPADELREYWISKKIFPPYAVLSVKLIHLVLANYLFLCCL